MLAELFESERRTVTTRQLALARRAWAAFTDRDPSAIERLLGANTGVLPFLGPALRRHLAEFPSLRDGLGLTERYALEAVALGEREPGPILAAVKAREAAPWLGDTMFWPYLTRLVSARRPLLRVANAAAWETGAGPSPALELALTATGEAVLSGRADAVWLNGINRWHGGAHLLGDDSPWRYDDDARRLVPRRVH
jgi:hypothetical protein